MFIQSFNKYKLATRLSVSFLFITIIFSVPTMTIEAASPIWQPLPLRTQAQKDAGMPGGEGMQMVFSISYAFSNPNIVYMAVDTSQVWKSTDGGNSWQSKRNGFRSAGGVSLVVDPRNENVVFVSGSIHRPDESLESSTVDGIYRTLDGGESWQLVKQTDYYRGWEGQHFAFDPNSFNGTRHQTIYAGTHSEGLFKSTNGGDTWSYIGLNGIRILDVELHRNGSNVILYVATDNTVVSGNGLYKVVDDGAATPIGNLPDYPRTIALDAQTNPNNDVIYAAVGSYKVYKSTNGGDTFSSRSTGLTVNNKEYKIIEISPADPKHLYVKLRLVGQLNPFYTLDGGATWKQPADLDDGDISTSGTGGSTYWATPMIPHPTKKNVALASLSETIMKTTNGGDKWVYSGNGYMGGRRGTGKTSAYFDPNNQNRIIFFLTDFGPIITEDGGDTWRILLQDISPATTYVGTVDPDNPNLIITAVGSWGFQGIIRSADGGINWRDSGKTGTFVFMSFHPQNPNYVYAGAWGKSFISNDKGQSWTEIPDKSIQAMFPGNGDIVYAIGTVHGQHSIGSILWRSTDKGTTWSQLTTNPFASIRDMDIDPRNSDVLYAATPIGLWRFDGSSWTEIGISNGIPTETFGSYNARDVHTVVVDPNNANTIYAGMWAPGIGQRERFIFRSTDYGKTWEDVRFNLEGYSTVWSLAVDPQTSDLHMSTDHGNYVLPFSSASNREPNGLINTPSGNITINVGDTVDFTGTGTYQDSNYPLSYLWKFGTGSGIPDSTQEDLGVVQFDNAGAFTVTFTVTDFLGLSDSTPDTRTITVIPLSNNPPVLQPIGDKTVDEGQLLNFTVVANDLDGNSLTLSTTNLPQGVTFTDNGDGSGVFSWTPDFDQTGTYLGVHFEVNDGMDTDFEDITITVLEDTTSPVMPTGFKIISN